MTSPTALIRVAYVEDDVRLAQLTAEYLRSHDLEVNWLARGDEVVPWVRTHAPDVVVLDLMLPGLSGMEACRQVRAISAVPIIMVTARGDEADRVIGLESGADDYLPKPFSPRELVARIRALVRRSRGVAAPGAASTNLLTVGPLTLDVATMQAKLGDAALVLTTHEFGLLRVFMERPDRVLSREQLLELTHASGDEAFDRSIDVQISRLRQKLGDDPRAPRFLCTMRGVGYVLRKPEAP